jgi:hypothetical protein
MATATTRRKASLSSAERLIVVLVVHVVVKLTISSEAAKNINITSYYSLLLAKSGMIVKRIERTKRIGTDFDSPSARPYPMQAE